MWSLVLELDGRPPRLLAETPSRDRAEALAMEAAIRYQHRAGKVTVSKTDSSDQLQRYSKDRFVRDQPHLRAAGQDTLVHVEPANALITEEEYRAIRRKA